MERVAPWAGHFAGMLSNVGGLSNMLLAHAKLEENAMMHYKDLIRKVADDKMLEKNVLVQYN